MVKKILKNIKDFALDSHSVNACIVNRNILVPYGSPRSEKELSSRENISKFLSCKIISKLIKTHNIYDAQGFPCHFAPLIAGPRLIILYQ